MKTYCITAGQDEVKWRNLSWSFFFFFLLGEAVKRNASLALQCLQAVWLRIGKEKE